jgi:large repetitive protein
VSVNSFSVISTNQIAANITILADAATGSKEVSVATPGGSFTLQDGFTVKQASPTITSINPGQGNQETSLTVTLDGTNLAGTGEAVFGSGINVNSVTVLSSNQVAVEIKIAAGAEIGTRDISVTTPGGSFTLPNSFTVRQALPLISSLSPAYGSQGATLNVTITGMNFSGANELRFGSGIALNSFTILDSKQITANITIVAGAAIGAMDVSVVTPGGSFSLPNGFTVKQGLPTIISIIPAQGGQGATLTIVINGSNLGGATSVSFGTGVAVQSFTNLSPTQLSVNLMIGEDAATGARDISVTTPGGSSTLGNSFSIKEKSFGTLIIAMIWIGIAVVVVLFVLFLRLIRKKRRGKV